MLTSQSFTGGYAAEAYGGRCLDCGCWDQKVAGFDDDTAICHVAIGRENGSSMNLKVTKVTPELFINCTGFLSTDHLGILNY